MSLPVADRPRSPAIELPGPILVARGVPAGAAFPGDVLVVSDGTAASRPVITATVAFVAGHRARPLLLHVGRRDRATRRELGAQAATLRLGTGAEPLALSSADASARAIARVIGEHRIAVVVIGECYADVAQRSPVSVLVVPCAPSGPARSCQAPADRHDAVLIDGPPWEMIA